MIVLSHELGHHTSFLRGFHDPELQLGLTLMQGKQYGEQACKYTWLVFREESTAWYHARQILGRSGFKDFDQFELVKNQSLKTYLSVLKLELASLDIYYKLSLLGDDFFNNCTSELFQKFT